MSDKTYVFPEVTLLITHYNRSTSLERLLKAFAALNCTFGEIIVSDDGSRTEHLQYLLDIEHDWKFTLLTTPKNQGLGNNINKGQDAVKTAYTLYVQEDFVPTAIFPEHFSDAFAFMEKDATLDTARFYAYFAYPVLEPYGKGFSRMVFKHSCLDHLKFYYYSDHPHLRRSSFLQKFGRYPEGIKGDLTEYKMAISVLQKKGQGIFFNEFTKLFLQMNSSTEPSTMERAHWRQRKNPFILLLRVLYLRYRWLKNTWDLLFMR